MKQIINFHTNTEYSFLESTITIDKLIEYAKNNNIKNLAITDHNNMYGVAKFLKETRKNNIKSIIGIDLDVDKYRYILIAKNYEGYVFISKLSSKKMANENISEEEIYSENIFILDHPRLGKYAKIKEELPYDNYFVNSLDVAKKNAIFIRENRILFQEENSYLSIINAISSGSIEDFNFQPFNFEIDDVPKEIIQRTNNLVDHINLEFPDKKNNLPVFKNDLGMTSKEYLRLIIKNELQAKEEELKKIPNVLTRVKEEIEIIESLGFEDYFLIIWDFIKWAKENKILIGPGRGSSGGSLISYLLNITEVNPLKYDLIFERFLNPKRVTMPDIDIDIQDTRRDEIIKYIVEKYGQENVALIITFQTLGAKMALRDVSRVLKIPLATVNELSKLIPTFSTLEETYNSVAAFRAKIISSPVLEQVFRIAKFIEGLPRQHGTHAAGIVISRERIDNLVPTILLSQNILQTQYSMEYLEEFGLLKIDLLGLKNLSTVHDVLETLNNRLNTNLKMEELPIFDETTNKLLSKGKTIGVFQLESPGMIGTLKKVGVSKIDDVVAIISLFRPGPMKNIPLYAERKYNNNSYESISSEYDEIVKSTYGIIIYQEQIMQIAQKVASMSFADADLLRRAISKKDFSEIMPIKTKFVLGAKNKGYSLETIENIFNQIEKFAEYGFNKSHAVAYAILAYRMAYLKSKYPLDFYSSLITNASGVQATIEKYVIEALSLGFKVKSPDINKSFNHCTNDGKREIYLPLIMIKGLGKVATSKIIEVREKNGEFTSFVDFITRMKEENFSDALIKILIKSNALAQFGNQRTLEENLDSLILYAEVGMIHKADGTQVFDKSIVGREFEIKQYEADLKEEAANQLELVGINFNAASTEKYEGDIKLDNMHPGTEHRLALVVEKITKFNDKRGKEMARISLSDSSKKITLLIFASRWDKFKDLKENSIYYFNIRNTNEEYTIDSNWKEIPNVK